MQETAGRRDRAKKAEKGVSDPVVRNQIDRRIRRPRNDAKGVGWNKTKQLMKIIEFRYAAGTRVAGQRAQPGDYPGKTGGLLVKELLCCELGLLVRTEPSRG